jgi:hypothetical protein
MPAIEAIEERGEVAPPVHRLMGRPAVKGKIVFKKDVTR